MPPYPYDHIGRAFQHHHQSQAGRQIELESEYAGRFHVLAARQDAPKSTSTSTAQGISASDFIQQAEDHWTVSATSILSAWATCAGAMFAIILVYSLVRRRWKIIYSPRVKLRKPSRPQEEKIAQQKSEEELRNNKAELRKYLRKIHDGKPEYYPTYPNEDGKWISRAPKAAYGFFEWMKPGFKEILIELKAVIPSWLRRIGGEKNKKETHKDEKREEAEIPKLPRTIFEHDVKTLYLLGLDAVVYLLFIRVLKYLFASISILSVLLATANYYINTQTSYGGTSAMSSSITTSNNDKSAKLSEKNETNILDNPQLLTAANIKSNGLVVHISFEIIVTLLVIVFVLKASSHHLALLKEWTHMNYNEVSFKTLMVTNLDISYSDKKQIYTVADAKQVIRTYLLGSGSINKTRRARLEGKHDRENINTKIWFSVHNMTPLHAKMEEFKEKYFKDAIKAVALETFYGRGKGQFYDTWKDMLCGRAKTAISRVNKAVEEKREIEALQKEIKKDQKHVKSTDLKGTVTSAFITVPTAKVARQLLKDRKEDFRQAGYYLQMAPRSHNVLWKNLEQDAKSRHSHAASGKIALWIICFINTVPVMFIVLLTNVGVAIDRFPELAKKKEESAFYSAVFMVLEGLLPATVAAIFSYALPYMMRRVNRWSGALTRGQLDRACIRQLFVFLLVSNFVVFSLLGVLYETYLSISERIGKESFQAIYESLGDLPAKVTRAYISNSLYWLSWYPIRSIVMWLQMLQIPRLVMTGPKLLFFKTPNELAEVAQADRFELFAVVVGLVYAPLAPLVAICATVHFWSTHIVHANSLKYINDTHDTDGAIWKVLINRLLAATVLMQSMMVLTVALKTRSAVMAVGAGIPIILVLWFKRYLSKHYDSDGEIFSTNIDKLKSKHEDLEIDPKTMKAPWYKHELLKSDWMPKGKTVKNESLLQSAMDRFPKLAELFSNEGVEGEQPNRRRRRGKNGEKG
ncbi:hypothetical protein IAT40_007240 [Kwoniella sp. CBS 6097]